MRHSDLRAIARLRDRAAKLHVTLADAHGLGVVSHSTCPNHVLGVLSNGRDIAADLLGDLHDLLEMLEERENPRRETARALADTPPATETPDLEPATDLDTPGNDAR